MNRSVWNASGRNGMGERTLQNPHRGSDSRRRLSDIAKDSARNARATVAAESNAESNPKDDLSKLAHLTRHYPGRYRRMTTGSRAPGLTYFVAAGGFIKIGHVARSRAVVLWRRIVQIQSSTPFRIEFLGAVDAAIATEYELHVRFAALAAGGDWFDDCSLLRRALREVLAGVVAEPS